ncbi:hypothetical protein MTO96_015339 [Rhipicephalus appendiculatus]
MTARRQVCGGDVAVSRDCATADEALDATECSDSASAPTSAMDFQERQEVCGCTCAATVVNLEEQLSEHQARIRQLERDLEGGTEEVKCASASAARVPELEMQLSLLQVHVQQLRSDLEARTKEFQPGDSVMADKGFKIQDLLSAKGVALNIPPFPAEAAPE